MRDTFEQHGSAWFAPCPELHSGLVFHAASEPRQAADPQQQQQQQVVAAAADAAASSSSDSDEAGSSGEEAEQRQGEQQQQQPAWQSQWAALGWLQDNPLVRLIPCLVFIMAFPIPKHWQTARGSRDQLCGRLASASESLHCSPQTRSLLTAPLLPAVQGVPTEREVLTTEQGLPVYRVMLRRL